MNMGSTLNAKLEAVNGSKMDLLITKNIDGKEETFSLGGTQVELDLHLASTYKNFVSISLTITYGTEVVVAKYYTITCVSDWMWFLLAIRRYHSEYISIKECRPDPFEIGGHTP